jgi:uncharacterized protein (DUF362 family)
MNRPSARLFRWPFGARSLSILIGLSALAWVILRTGRKPSRVVYPCQRAALSTSWMFLGVPLAGFITSARWRRPAVWITAIAVGVLALVFAGAPVLRCTPGDATAAALSAHAERVPSWSERGFPGRVVHVHDAEATSWDFVTGWYGDYVDQGVVDAMMTEGLLALTGTQSLQSAWEVLIPDFVPGERLAIKVNLNNATEPPGNAIDAIIEPVNALIGGLIDYGFAATDISVYDVTHAAHAGVVPQRFIDGCDYPGVNFVAYVDNPDPYSTTEFVHFDPPSGSGISDRPLANVVVEADYLINMPIMKKHDYAGISLSFKNHFGSFRHCDFVHGYVFPMYPDYTPDYSPFVDMHANEHLGGKTVLTVGDGIYGNWEHLWSPPPPWSTFGDDAPNSLFLATDAVAVDCVMADFIAFEGTVPATADDYLVLASAAGMGVFERAAVSGEYAIIDYEYIEAPFVDTGIEGDVAARSAILSVAPTPTSDSARVLVEVPRAERVEATVQIFNARGQRVATLLKGEVAGERRLVWDGTDEAGNRVASGVYWCTLDCEGRRESARIVLVR